MKTYNPRDVTGEVYRAVDVNRVLGDLLTLVKDMIVMLEEDGNFIASVVVRKQYRELLKEVNG